MPSIIPNTNNLHKSKAHSGAATMNCGDHVADILAGRSLEAIRHMAFGYGVDCDKYLHLNPGHQRMVIGNRLRKILRVDANVRANQMLDDMIESNTVTGKDGSETIKEPWNDTKSPTEDMLEQAFANAAADMTAAMDEASDAVGDNDDDDNDDEAEEEAETA